LARCRLLPSRLTGSALPPRRRPFGCCSSLYTGLRIAELAGLDTGDVPLSARKGTVFVREGKGGDLHLLHETRDMIRLAAALAEEVGYSGSWLLGVHLERLSGHESEVVDLYSGGMLAQTTVFEAPMYSASTRASALELRDKPEEITGRLMRKLMRGLGTEVFLSQPPFGSTDQIQHPS
jgi:hypothetical protein